nr:hypothetical protein BaRGS_027210 [Batillaria attramentaria]
MTGVQQHQQGAANKARQASLGGSAGGPVSPAALFKPLTLYEPGLVGPGGYLAPPLTAYPTAALVNHFYTLPYHRPDYGLFDRHPALAKGELLS